MFFATDARVHAILFCPVLGVFCDDATRAQQRRELTNGVRVRVRRFLLVHVRVRIGGKKLDKPRTEGEIYIPCPIVCELSVASRSSP